MSDDTRREIDAVTMDIAIVMVVLCGRFGAENLGNLTKADIKPVVAEVLFGTDVDGNALPEVDFEDGVDVEGIEDELDRDDQPPFDSCFPDPEEN